MIGIYKITSPSKKVYIGQSVDIEKRFIQYINSGAKPKGNILYQSRFRPGLVKKMDEYLEQLKKRSDKRTKNRFIF